MQGSTSEPFLPAYVDKQDTRVLGLHSIGPPRLGQIANYSWQDTGFALQAVLALPRDHLQGTVHQLEVHREVGAGWRSGAILLAARLASAHEWQAPSVTRRSLWQQD